MYTRSLPWLRPSQNQVRVPAAAGVDQTEARLLIKSPFFGALVLCMMCVMFCVFACCVSYRPERRLRSVASQVPVSRKPWSGVWGIHGRRSNNNKLLRFPCRPSLP